MTEQVITPYQRVAAQLPTFIDPDDDREQPFHHMGDLILDVKNKQYLLGALIDGKDKVKALIEYMPVLCSAQEFNNYAKFKAVVDKLQFKYEYKPGYNMYGTCAEFFYKFITGPLTLLQAIACNNTNCAFYVKFPDGTLRQCVKTDENHPITSPALCEFDDVMREFGDILPTIEDEANALKAYMKPKAMSISTYNQAIYALAQMTYSHLAKSFRMRSYGSRCFSATKYQKQVFTYAFKYAEFNFKITVDIDNGIVIVDKLNVVYNDRIHNNVENDDDHYNYAEPKKDRLWSAIFLIPTEILDAVRGQFSQTDFDIAFAKITYANFFLA